MRNLSRHQLQIGREAERIEPWFHPVFERGRAAAFVDTGFVKALVNPADPWAAAAQRHFNGSSGVTYYTTNLVLAEVARQVAKDKGIAFPVRARWFDACTNLLIDGGQIFVCAPPREIVIEAYRELAAARISLPGLDLCDALSIVVLDYAKHRRVFGFDGHFRSFGAHVEP